MRNNSFNIKAIILPLIFLVGITTTAFTQDEVPLKTRVDLTCIQSADTPVELVGKLRAKEGRSYVPVRGKTIEFFIVTSEDYVSIGESVTDINGDARVDIEDENLLEKDEDGYYTVSASYEGSGQYEENEEEFYFKKAYILMETSEDEETKTVEATAYEVTDDGDIPIVDVELMVAVPMMFSNLPIGVEYTDDDGYVTYEFPNDLPGDENGEIKLMAEILESDDYGTIRQEEFEEWGIPKAIVIEQSRMLWTPDAPLWMVITFTLLMLAVWGHVVYIVYRLVQLKNEGKVEAA